MRAVVGGAIAGAAVLVPIPAWSAPEEAETPYAFETVVTANRRDWRRFDSDRSIDSVDGEDGRAVQAPTIPDALRETTGVFVQSTNRGAGAPILRGMIGPQNLILVDGIRFNNSTFRTGPNQYLATFDPFAIDRMEVLRGPGSVLYGSDAMGGVVNLRTHALPGPKSEAGWGAAAEGRFGSGDLARQGAFEAQKVGPGVSVGLGGSLGLFDTLTAGNGIEQPASGFEQAGWRGRLRWDGGPWTLRGAYFGTIVDDAGRADALGKGEVRFYDNDDHFAYLRASRGGKGMLHQIEWTLSYHRTEEAEDILRCRTGAAPADCATRAAPLRDRTLKQDAVDTFGVSGLLHSRLIHDEVRLTSGLEAYRDGVASRAQKGSEPTLALAPTPRGNFSNRSSYLLTGAFVHGEATVARLGTLDFIPGAGVRLTHVRAHAPDVPVGEPRDVNYAFTGVVGTAGVRAVMADALNVYANFSQGFRAPNLQETTTLGDTGSTFEIPNPDLEPERSDTLEFGIKARRAPVSGAVAVFQSNISGFIDVEPSEFNGSSEVNGKPVRKRVNRDGAVYRGAEISAESDPLFGVRLLGGIALVEGEVDRRKDDGSTETVPARRVPPLFGHVGARYDVTHEAWAGVFVRWAAEQEDLHPSDRTDLRICEDPSRPGETFADGSCPGTPGWQTVHLRGAWRIARGVELNISVENLLDERYRLHGSGWDAPGRQLLAGVRGEI